MIRPGTIKKIIISWGWKKCWNQASWDQRHVRECCLGVGGEPPTKCLLLFGVAAPKGQGSPDDKHLGIFEAGWPSQGLQTQHQRHGGSTTHGHPWWSTKWSQNDPKVIPRSSRMISKLIPKRSQNYTKTISKRSPNHSKRNTPISQNGTNISWV